MKVKSFILCSLMITSIIFTGCDIFNNKNDSNKDIILLMYTIDHGLNRGSMTFTVSGQTINFISKNGFDYYPFGYYSGSFESDSYDFSNIGIMVPTDVSQGKTYNETSDFYFSNIVKYNTSFNTSGHNFYFNVNTWEGIGGKIEATFSGDICASGGVDCILIENGSLEASIVDISSM